MNDKRDESGRFASNDYETVYRSKLLNKDFKSVSDLKNAEAEYKKAHEAELKAKQEKAERANKVEEAYKHAMKVRTECADKIREADKEYINLRNQFIKDYGYYHATYSSVNDWENFFNDLLNFNFLR